MNVQIQRLIRYFSSLTLAILPLAGAQPTDAADWPNWLGPQQNRVSTETGLVDGWNPKGGANSHLIWQRDDLGTRSTPVVLNGNLYILSRHDRGTAVEKEKVVCLDAATGDTKWEHQFNVYLSDVPDTRVAWSSCVADPETGRVYALGVCGYFCCLDGETGDLVWSRRLHEEYGLITTYGGRTNIPLVFEDLVLISGVIVNWGDTPQFDNLARPAHRFLAFDKSSGELRWLNGTSISPYDTTYSTPTIAVIGGEQQLVFASGDGGIWGLQPRTGERLWNYPFSRRGINVSPLVAGDRVFASHGEENVVGTTMGAVVALDGTMRGDLTDKQLWLKYEVMAGKSSPVIVNDQLWVVDDRAKLQILDPSTGEQIGRKALGTVMRSTPLVADGKVYIMTNGGRWWILKPNNGSPEEIQKTRLGTSNDGSPIAADGRIYLPTTDVLFCIGDPDADTGESPLPEPPQETPIAEGDKPTLLQLAPYDLLLAPGDSYQFTGRLYNQRGQLLGMAEDAEFSVSGPGEVDADGRYTAPDEAHHVGALVVAKVGDLEGHARVRIVPPLPWSFDFDEDEDMPISWVGGRVRYQLRDVDGQRSAVKRNVLPTPRDPNNKLGTRSQMFMGSPDLHDYTIQADFRPMATNGELPDYGLINSGYNLNVRASTGVLRLCSWSPHDYRTSATVDHQPQDGVWYRMKLQVEQGDGVAHVRGKIWPRDEDEPAEWTLEMTDKSPIQSGSPGLFGKTDVAEFAVDNVKVAPNN